MALLAVRSTFVRVGCVTSTLGKQIHPLNCSKTAATAPIQVAGLKATYGEKYPYAKPWPNWENRKYTLLHEYTDPTGPRMNENSKIIIVDGNMAVGKNDFARRLAKGFDLKCIESITDTDCYTVNGYDLRAIDDMLPLSAKFYDVKKFLTETNPKRGMVGRLQMNMFFRKFLAYARGLHHLFSTGQGFVMVRSPFTDHVLIEACKTMGYITPQFAEWYYDMRDGSICELLKPHVTIYLDAPVDVIQERIKKRNVAYEQNSPILQTPYLTNIENQFKERTLPRLRESGEVVEIDWTEVADDQDMEVIYEEIQRLDLTFEDPDDSKFADWRRCGNEDYLCHYRKYFGSKWQMKRLFCIPYPWDCPEILIDEDDRASYLNNVIMHPAFDSPGRSEKLGQRDLWSFF